MTVKLIPLFERDIRKVEYLLACAAGNIKTYCGGVNNATFYWMDDCIDAIRRDRRFRHQVKRAFNDVIASRARMEQFLLYPPPGELTYFDVNEISQQYKERFKNDLTKAEYFEFWKATGGLLYARTLPLIKALCWKYERILTRMNVPNPHPLAMCMTCECLFAIGQSTYHACINQCKNDVPTLNRPLEDVFCRFDMKSVSDLWSQAVALLLPHVYLTQEEEHDLTAATAAIVNIWDDPKTYLSLMDETMDDYSTEIFRSKRSMREFHDKIQQTRQSIDEDRMKEKINKMKQQWENEN